MASTGSEVQNVLGFSSNNSNENIANHESLDLSTSSLALAQDSHEELSKISYGANKNSNSSVKDSVVNIGCQRASSVKSLCSSNTLMNKHSLEQSLKASSSTTTLRKDYTHQVVVVAPLTGLYLINTKWYTH